jgi:hypothetical protein
MSSMDTTNLYCKVCPKCNKKFVAEKGFTKDSFTKDGYYTYCKICKREQENALYAKQKGYVFDYHQWEEPDSFGMIYCKRCGIKSKDVGNVIKNHWHKEYFVKGKWQKEHVECIINK